MSPSPTSRATCRPRRTRFPECSLRTSSRQRSRCRWWVGSATAPPPVISARWPRLSPRGPSSLTPSLSRSAGRRFESCCAHQINQHIMRAERLGLRNIGIPKVSQGGFPADFRKPNTPRCNATRWTRLGSYPARKRPRRAYQQRARITSLSGGAEHTPPARRCGASSRSPPRPLSGTEGRLVISIARRQVTEEHYGPSDHPVSGADRS